MGQSKELFDRDVGLATERSQRIVISPRLTRLLLVLPWCLLLLVTLSLYPTSPLLPWSLPFPLAHKPAHAPTDVTLALEPHCSSIPPISRTEFIARQSALVSTLSSLPSSPSLYITEPSSNGLYFGNVSTNQWWLSERVFLLVFTRADTDDRDVGAAEGETIANLTILTPLFELDRARQLIPNIPHHPSIGNVTFVAWAEWENPYEVLVRSLPQVDGLKGGKAVLDPMMRKFVVDGLAEAGIESVEGGYPKEVGMLRERKSEGELALLRCANEATVLAIRELKKHLYYGIRESETRALLSRAMGAVGLKGGEGLVLFGENAALPHGSGTDRALGKGEFVLIDVGGSLHGYVSDITRTFTIDPPSAHSIPSARIKLWYTVLAAQKAALSRAREGGMARDVDALARKVIGGGLRKYLSESGREEVDVDRYFGHRLGHGIGLDGHESPYLVGGESNTAVLASNNTFSDEPGIYILNEIGIRLEDCFYVSEDGKGGVLLTEGTGGFARSPWEP